jgi:hypothetical protein
MSEKIPPLEFTEEEQGIISKLNGLSVEEALSEPSFLRWLVKQEESADREETSSGRIRCLLKIARLKAAAGFLDLAWEDLSDENVRVAANQEGLLAEVDGLLDEIENRY